MSCFCFFFKCNGDQRDLPGSNHSFPTRPSSDLSPEAIHRPWESDLRRRSVGVAVEVVDGGADDRSAAALLDDDGTAAAPGRLGRGKVEREGHRLKIGRAHV